MEIERVRPDGLFRGVPYAYASVVPPGTLVFAAGACPLDADGATVAPGDYEAQARQTLANLFATLGAAGARPGDVVKSTVFVASNDQTDLVKVWTVVRAAFGDDDPPSTLLGVAALGYRDQLVEIEAVAVAPAR